jgi:hypothetical protein
MAFQLHVAMSGDPSRFPFLSFGMVGAVLLAPVGLIPYLKLKKIRGSSVR